VAVNRWFMKAGNYTAKVHDLVLCEWEDSYGCSAHWQTVEPDCEPRLMTCKSVGWIIRKNKRCIVIVPHLSLNTEIAEQQGCGDMTIPTASIVKIRPINAASFCVSPAPSRKRQRF
jgi:hypothetical protein